MLPGSTHGLTTALTHGIVDALTVRMPFKRRPYRGRCHIGRRRSTAPM